MCFVLLAKAWGQHWKVFRTRPGRRHPSGGRRHWLLRVSLRTAALPHAGGGAVCSALNPHLSKADHLMRVMGTLVKVPKGQPGFWFLVLWESELAQRAIIYSAEVDALCNMSGFVTGCEQRLFNQRFQIGVHDLLKGS